MNNKEKNTVSKMIRIYCRSKHRQKEGLCDDCRQLEQYAHARLERCPYGERKPACNKCPIHCYKPDYKEKVKVVMRFAGPRMLWYHPVDAVIHLMQVLKKSYKEK